MYIFDFCVQTNSFAIFFVFINVTLKNKTYVHTYVCTHKYRDLKFYPGVNSSERLVVKVVNPTLIDTGRERLIRTRLIRSST